VVVLPGDIELSGVDGQRQDRQEGVNGARQRIRCRRAGPRRAEYGDRAPAGGRMGGRARHPEGQDRPAGSLLRPGRHVVVGSEAGDQPGTCGVVEGPHRSPDSRRSGHADRRQVAATERKSRCRPHPRPHCSTWTCDPESRRCCGSRQPATRRAGRPSTATRCAPPVADSPTVLRALPTELIKRFEKVGWLLIRNYNDDIGASVADAFGTDDRRAVEDYCRANAIKFEWQPDGALRTWQRRSAVVHHPLTGQQCWFNQIAFLNEWTMDPEVREYLADIYGEDGLPSNTRLGNGGAICEDAAQL